MRKGIEDNKQNLELRQYLILSYLHQEKWELATKELKDALELSPNNIELLFQLAEIKKKSGDYKQALDLYKRILTISPNNEKADKEYFRLRLMLLEKGN